METIQKKIDTLENKTYEQSDLGMTYHEGTYTFKVWSPLAKEVHLNVYKTGDIQEDTFIKQYPMAQTNNVWTIDLTEEMDGLFYTYSFDHNGWETEAPDLYSKAVGINGDRTAIVDLDETDPDGWENDGHVMQKSLTDAMIWEVHVEDFSIDSASGIRPEYQGKYLGFTEEDTTLYNAGDFPTGLNYLSQLGVNYVHLLPIYDFVNEEEDKTSYNWGYDPKNFMAPEGKYSSDPRDPKARIKELKQLIQSLHNHEIGIVMDVVYNHTFHTEDSWFQFTVPDYYYRQDAQGNFSNGSGVGNETASERTMMRKYMIDSLLYWVEEYHIDGFRFDLMGVHDTETMNEIRKALDDNGYEDIIIYGEPWAGGELGLKHPHKPADRNHVHDYSEEVALFNADFRDAVKGDVFLEENAAFLQGANHPHSSSFQNEDLIAAIMANTQTHAGGYTLSENKAWARSPKEVVNYSSAHDNFTLYDKLVLSTDGPISYRRQERLVTMNKINAVLLFTSQGGTFLQAGEEFARTKHGNPNTYNASIAINHLDWSRAAEYEDLINYYRGMMAIRKAYPPLRDETAKTADAMTFRKLPENIMAYTIPNVIDADAKWENLLVAVNTGSQPQSYVLPSDEEQNGQQWTVLANNKEAKVEGLGTISGKSIILNPREVYVLAIEK